MKTVDDIALLMGRLLLAALMLPAGVRKLMDIGGTTQMLGRLGVPAPEVLAVVASVVEVGVPVLLILGLVPRITAILAAGFVLVATVLAHRFWEASDSNYMAQQIQFLKNLGLMGGCLFYFVAGSGRFALGRR